MKVESQWMGAADGGSWEVTVTDGELSATASGCGWRWLAVRRARRDIRRFQKVHPPNLKRKGVRVR